MISRAVNLALVVFSCVMVLLYWRDGDADAKESMFYTVYTLGLIMLAYDGYKIRSLEAKLKKYEDNAKE